MPTIIVQTTSPSGDGAAHITLTERVLATHLDDKHHAGQLIERLSWAVADAEALEQPSDSRAARRAAAHARLPAVPARQPIDV